MARCVCDGCADEKLRLFFRLFIGQIGWQMAYVQLDRPIRPAQRLSLFEFLDLLRDSCNAFNRYEELRHMSDAQLRQLGIHRHRVCDQLFAELFGQTKH